MRYTVNPTDDPKVGTDGYYLSQTDVASGEKATAVYNGDGSLANVPANRDWQLPSPQ